MRHTRAPFSIAKVARASSSQFVSLQLINSFSFFTFGFGLALFNFQHLEISFLFAKKVHQFFDNHPLQCKELKM
jgi:hypothetical protein